MFSRLTIAFGLGLMATAAMADDAPRTLPAASELSYLSKVVGAQSQVLLRDDRVAEALNKTFSPDELARLRAIDLTTIERAGKYLVFSGYQFGTRFDNGAVVFINIDTGLAQACWSENGMDTWRAPNSAPRSLGQDACINDSATLITRFGA